MWRATIINVPQLHSQCKRPIYFSAVKHYFRPGGDIILSSGTETYEEYRNSEYFSIYIYI